MIPYKITSVLIIANNQTEIDIINKTLKSQTIDCSNVFKTIKAFEALSFINKYKPKLVISTHRLKEASFFEIYNLSIFKGFNLILYDNTKKNYFEENKFNNNIYIIDSGCRKKIKTIFNLAIKDLFMLPKDKGLKIGIKTVELKYIMFISARSSYSELTLASSKKKLLSYNLAYIENLLSSSFIRVHKSYIINKSYIESINVQKREIQLKNGKLIPISIRKLKELQKTELIFH